MSRTYLAGYWGDRPASLAASASTLAEYLATIAEVDDDYAAWYLKGRTPREAMDHAIAIDRENLEGILSAHLRKGPDRSPEIESELGFPVSPSGC